MREPGTCSILRIGSSARHASSLTRRLGDEVIRRLRRAHPGAVLRTRELAGSVDLIDERWVQANLTDPAARRAQQRSALAGSDRLLQELDAADVIVLTTPVYNFSIPAALKAWIDMICRARLSFRYTPDGPVGLLRDRPAYLVMASGGTAFSGPADFACGYLRHVLAFIGLHDVRVVQAERTGQDAAASVAAALEMLSDWLPASAAPATT
jgi:FMN-dependent NADH-azoreductase